MKNNINDEIIIGYINNVLSNDDRISFEKEMETNTTLAERYAFLKNVATTTHLVAEENFRKKLAVVDAKLETENFFSDKSLVKVNSVRKTPKLQYAAAFVCLLLVAGLSFINFKYSDAAIASAFMADEDMRTQATRSEITDAQKDLENYESAIKLFKENEIPNSIALLNKIDSSSENYFDAQYALAFINYHQGNLEKAIQRAKKLWSEESDLKDKAGWLYLNAAIAKNGYDEKLLTNYIESNPEKYYLKRAKKLQKQLEASIRSLVF